MSFERKGNPKLIYFDIFPTRFVKYLKSGVASLRVEPDGNLHATVAVDMKGLINLEHNKKEIRKYLKKDE